MTSFVPLTDQALRHLVAEVRRAPALVGGAHLVCIDGVTGAGKSTAAATLARLWGEPVRVLHTDEMLQGWRGLPGLADVLETLLSALAVGRDTSWRRWDWHRDTWGESVVEPAVVPGELVVLEGVGAAVGAAGRLASRVLWVETDPDERRARWLARDGAAMLQHFETWSQDEALLHRTHRTAEWADVRFWT